MFQLIFVKLLIGFLCVFIMISQDAALGFSIAELKNDGLVNSHNYLTNGA